MSIFTYLRRHAVISIVVGLAVIFIAVVAGRAASRTAPPDNASGTKLVTLTNAASFRVGNIAVSANGVVESHSQADLRSQVSAPVAAIYGSIGETIYAGQTILELQNSDIRAQLMQAQASLELAKGQYSTGAVSLESAKQAALDKLRDAYNKTYSAVTAQADPILYNSSGSGNQLITLSDDTNLNSEITTTDLDLRTGLREWKSALDALSSTSDVGALESAIKIAQKYMAKADLLLNDMSKLLNKLTTSATPPFTTTLATWIGIVTGAQSSVSGATQALTAAQMTLNTSNTSQGSTANAQVAIAQAGVNNLEAQLAKTVIRSPITGRISNLPLRQGELASPGALLATVIGDESGIEIKVYVSGDDLSRIQVGAPVTIRGNTQAIGTSTQNAIKGTVSNVSPSIDATTRKAEVDIDVLNSDTSGLVIGNTVTVSISPLKTGSEAVASNASASNKPTTYLLPIQDVKIVPGAAFVFTVDSQSKIVRHDITLGRIQGDFIEVVGGLTDDLDIVTPVYELDEGQTVKVQ